MLRRLGMLLVVLSLATVFDVLPAGATAIETQPFTGVWTRTDQPVAAEQVSRTWMWGPAAFTNLMTEGYAESPAGMRLVQYFDKSRMEITHPDGDPTSIWYVTNGLLAEELITGKMQLGDNTYKQLQPAQVNVAGDPNDPNGPTYASFNSLMSYSAVPSGWVITQNVNRAGQVGNDPSTAQYIVTAKDVTAPTHHNVASVFWTFMNSSGLVNDNGTTATEPLFQNPFYATGYPLTEAYWTNVLVGGVQKQVLVQVFERRVLTYTPSNPAGWQVEAGNVGQHYFRWRYGTLADQLLTPQSTLDYLNGEIQLQNDFQTKAANEVQVLDNAQPTAAWLQSLDAASTAIETTVVGQQVLVPPAGYEAYQGQMMQGWYLVAKASSEIDAAFHATPVNTAGAQAADTELEHAWSVLKSATLLLPGEVMQPGWLIEQTAVCNDGWISTSQHASGTCSSHGGVAIWINQPSS